MKEIIKTFREKAETGGNYGTMKHSTETAAATRMNGIDRRHLIEIAAVSLFAKYGFRGTTTKEIAAQAGVSEASLFQYFNTKAELYAVILADQTKNICDDWLNEINAYATCNDDENLFRAVAAKISEQCQKDSDFLRLMLFSTLEGHAQAKQFYGLHINSLYELLCKYIKRRQDEKAFQSCEVEAVAQGFIGAQIYCAVTEMLSGNVFGNNPGKESNTDFTRLTLDGLRCGALQRKKYTGIY